MTQGRLPGWEEKIREKARVLSTKPIASGQQAPVVEKPILKPLEEKVKRLTEPRCESTKLITFTNRILKCTLAKEHIGSHYDGAGLHWGDPIAMLANGGKPPP